MRRTRARPIRTPPQRRPEAARAASPAVVAQANRRPSTSPRSRSRTPTPTRTPTRMRSTPTSPSASRAGTCQASELGRPDGQEHRRRSANNKGSTDQDATATQTGGSSSRTSGCGGNGQEQNVIQDSQTKQSADADATAKQNVVNANVPVSIAGGDVNGGISSANQTATNRPCGCFEQERHQPDGERHADGWQQPLRPVAAATAKSRT
jgi:hypothetical protein